MPNQRAIARELGLTQATVSMALRGDPSISKATCLRVREAAERLGYRPNPLVTSLMERIRSGREVSDHGCIAVVVDASSQKEWIPPENSTYRRQYAGYQAQAALRGYRTECFYVWGKGMSPEAVDRQLYSRGVIGVILAAPKRRSTPPVTLRWERYALSTVSYTWATPLVDRVSSHHRHSMDLAFSEACRRGYLRIGFCLPDMAVHGVDANWMAGFLIGQSHLPKTRRLPPFVGTVRDTSLEKFRVWYDRWRPDVLITLLGEEVQWTRELKLSIPHDLGLICLNRPEGSPFTGIDENNEVVGATACDLVVNQITHNERGLPPHPKAILIEGTWHEGASLPVRKSV